MSIREDIKIAVIDDSQAAFVAKASRPDSGASETETGPTFNCTFWIVKNLPPGKCAMMLALCIFSRTGRSRTRIQSPQRAKSFSLSESVTCPHASVFFAKVKPHSYCGFGG